LLFTILPIVTAACPQQITTGLAAAITWGPFATEAFARGAVFRYSAVFQVIFTAIPF